MHREASTLDVAELVLEQAGPVAGREEWEERQDKRGLAGAEKASKDCDWHGGHGGR